MLIILVIILSFILSLPPSHSFFLSFFALFETILLEHHLTHHQACYQSMLVEQTSKQKILNIWSWLSQMLSSRKQDWFSFSYFLLGVIRILIGLWWWSTHQPRKKRKINKSVWIWVECDCSRKRAEGTQ